MSKKSRERAEVIVDALQEAGFDATMAGSPTMELVLIDIDAGEHRTARLRIEDDGHIVIEHEYKPGTVSSMLREARLEPYTRARSKMWSIYSLDVWGNEEDGFEVNNRQRAGDIEILDGASDEDIIKTLKQEGFLKAKVKASQIHIDGDDYAMNVDDAETGEPIYQLESR
jgi:predicted RNA binding protein YcfA (HicA-like mRNA interferase family)